MAKSGFRPAPILIAMKGHPATGKSNVAAALARRLRSPLIDKDDIKDHVLDTLDANERAYTIMWQIAGVQLALRLNVIAVSPLSYPATYAAALALADRHRGHLLVVETRLEEEEWKRRLNNRRAGYSTHKISGWAAMQEMLRQYDGCWQYPIPAAQHIVVDTAQPLKQSINQVIMRVDELRRQPVDERVRG
jgi:predicted kinase